MIPRFPEFQKLGSSDREAVEAHSKLYPPYSDFNFTSMWSWDTEEALRLSELNDNLIVRFTDYVTAEPFYMFLGTYAVNETVDALLTRSSQEGLPPVLKLIPEIVVERLDRTLFSAEPDPDHADYVLSVEKLRGLEGPGFAPKRREMSRFVRLHTQSRFASCDVADPGVVRGMHELFELWLVQKNAARIPAQEHEFVAMRRCLESNAGAHLVLTAVFVNEVLKAFWLIEDLGNGHAISHFEKADTADCPGIFAYLKQKTAEVLEKRGITYINLEQDLGIEGLRQSKASYLPHEHLRKYRVRWL